MISIFETVLKDAPPMKTGVSSKMKEYLEKLKSEKEKVFGKQQDNKNVNPLIQFGRGNA